MLKNDDEEGVERMIKQTKQKVIKNIENGKWELTQNQLAFENGKTIKLKAASHLRDYENIPFLMYNEDGKLVPQSIDDYYEREVKPHLELSWIDPKKTKIGYTINFTKYFYEYKPLRPLEEIKADIMALEEKVFEKEQHILEE